MGFTCSRIWNKLPPRCFQFLDWLGIMAHMKKLLYYTVALTTVNRLFLFLLIIVSFTATPAKAGLLDWFSTSQKGIYRTADNSQSLNIISGSKMEYQDSDGTFPGSYTLDGDTIRMELTISGTPQVFYFTKVEQGWQEKDGALFLSPHYFAAVQILQKAKDGDLEKVTSLLKDYPDLVFSKDTDSKTALSLAAANGHKDVADLLLANKADANAKDSNGMTPLIEAADNGDTDMVKLLLTKGANVNAKDNGGSTALLKATQKQNEDVAGLLLANKADVNAKDNSAATPMNIAIGNKETGMVKLLLANGADINIYDAAKIGVGDKIASLLNTRPDLVSSRDSDGMTPLFYAVINQHKDVVELLLAHNADVNAKDTGNEEPLQYAAENGDKEIVASLLAKGADVNASVNGHTPLHWAAEYGSTDAAALLIAKGANVNAKDSDGWTPLFWAVQNKHQDMVELLLANKADVNARDKLGETCLSRWTNSMDDDMRSFLTQHGGNVSNP